MSDLYIVPKKKEGEKRSFAYFLLQVYLSMSSGVGDQTMDFKLHMVAMMEEFKQSLDEAFEPLHRRLDRMVNKDVKRRGSPQFHPDVQPTSSKSLYSRRREEVHSTTKHANTLSIDEGVS